MNAQLDLGIVVDEHLHTILLAQGMGLFFVMVAIIMLVRANFYQEQLTHLKVGSSTITLAATIGLMISIALILIHNIWIWESEVLITIIAWLLLIKSLFWLSFPSCMVNCSQKLYSGWKYYAVAIVVAIVGVILMAHGFYPYMG